MNRADLLYAGPDDEGSGVDTDLAVALSAIRDAVARTRFPLRLPDALEHRDRTSRILHQLDDYVLPRLATMEAPLLCVVGGSTGAGKSTLVNSLVGSRVTVPGITRPTTRAPVLVHHPDDLSWFADERILPGMARVASAVEQATVEGTRSLHLVAEPTLPRGLALLDAPDVDSIDTRNRELAAQLLAAADLWLFVTSAARYADAVPWGYLHEAANRSAAVGVVLDRVREQHYDELGGHLGQLMQQAGLGDSPLFAVPETSTDEDGLLPAAAVQPIKAWLAELARDQTSRAAVVHQTLTGAIAALADDLPLLADGLDEQRIALDTLRRDADQSYQEAVRSVAVQTADGTLLRGEVLSRWHEFVGTGEFFRALEQRISWLRDKVVAAVRGRPESASKVSEAVETSLDSLIRESGDAAAERVERAWRAHPAGRELLQGSLLADSSEDLSRSSRTFAAEVSRAIRDWQSDVLALVADEGMSKRSKARFLAFGVNAIGVALMIVVFTQTGGLVGAEVGVAGGTAVLAQRVLEAVFGDQAIRTLARRAKEELDSRVETLLAVELGRYHRVLDAVEVQDPSELRSAAAAITPGGAGATAVVAVEPTQRPAELASGNGAVAALEAGDEVEIVDAEIVDELYREPR